MKKTSSKQKRKNKKKLSTDELRQRKEQRNHIKEIRDIFLRLGYTRIKGVDGKNFKYKDRTTELDDIFVYENTILLIEYTIGNPHILEKKIIYDKINSNIVDFIEYIVDGNIYEDFSQYYYGHIKSQYSLNQLQLRIVYCSKQDISSEHKKIVDNVIFMDYHIVKYFKCLTQVIKRSAIFEFLDFLKIKEDDFGTRILYSPNYSSSKFCCHILPEEKSSYHKGYKIISFYMDAESLLKRAYVLRQEGWRAKDGASFYQRMLDAKKISAMRRYLAEQGRVFINNIIATVSEKDIIIYKDKDKSERISINENGDFVGNNKITRIEPAYIEIPNRCNIIGLIDGQHRTFAYHEGEDQYETQINQLRKIQNLLVTGIIFPKSESDANRIKFEANLFLEINSNQKKVGQAVQQEIQMQTQPFSSIAIGKQIIYRINNNGPLSNMIELHSYQNGKIKTASIVSFGLKPLIKIDESKQDSLFFSWNNQNKKELLDPKCINYDLLQEYINYCANEINYVLSAFKSRLDASKWHTYSTKTQEGVLTVTFINGLLNLIRLLIENDKLNGFEFYKNQLIPVNEFDFKIFKSSQYRKLGEALYNKYFNICI